MRELVDAVRAKSALLFVGAGVSMNLGTPSWKQLSGHMARRLGVDPDEFAALGDDRTLAEFYALETGSIGPLRSWMDVEWHRDAADKVRGSDIHRLIVELGFPLIYTTNYDRYLELAHQAHGVPFTKIANLGELASATPGVTQIVKFHGDFEDDGSIVLAESSHFDRLSLEGPLDLKLRSDLLGRVALFIGYSVSDVGIRYLIYRLHKLWSGSAYAQARPRAYVFLGRHNPVQARVLSSWGIVPLFSDEPDIGTGLRHFLRGLLAAARREPAPGGTRDAPLPAGTQPGGPLLHLTEGTVMPSDTTNNQTAPADGGELRGGTQTGGGEAAPLPPIGIGSGGTNSLNPVGTSRPLGHPPEPPNADKSADERDDPARAFEGGRTRPGHDVAAQRARDAVHVPGTHSGENEGDPRQIPEDAPLPGKST